MESTCRKVSRLSGALHCLTTFYGPDMDKELLNGFYAVLSSMKLVVDLVSH